MAAYALVEVTADPFATVRAVNRMRRAGFSLSVEAGGLVVTPASSLTDAQRAYLRDNKDALLALLADAETLATTLSTAGPAGLGWREGTPTDWTDIHLLAVGEVLYADGRMVSATNRRYSPESAPAVALGSEYHPADYAPEVEPQAEVAA